MRYAVRSGLPDSPTTAQVSHSSSMKRTVVTVEPRCGCHGADGTDPARRAR